MAIAASSQHQTVVGAEQVSLAGRVSALWRYPVSSLTGEPRDGISIKSDGVVGDRLFGIVDCETGEPARPDAGPRWHAAPFATSRLKADGGVQVSVRGGPWLDATGTECDAALSALFGFPVSLRPFEGTQADDYRGLTTEPRYQKAPIHLLTTASLARLKALHPAGDPDMRRFRPNILVDMPAVDGSFPETEWIGRRLAIGDVELTISEPCRRCGFTTIAQDGFDLDPDILRNLVRHNARNIGVYCTIDKPGEIGIGASMRLL